jgi:hypothetical protein
MVAYVAGARSHFAPILHLSGTSIRLNCYMSIQKDPAGICICTSMWGAISNIIVTGVNVRNVFYYKVCEYAHLTIYKKCGQLTVKFLT